MRLRALGHDAHHVDELALGAATDAIIWRHVCHRRATLITKDQDFIGFARTGAEGSAVIWIRLGNATNQALWKVFQPLLPEITQAISAGEKLIEVA